MTEGYDFEFMIVDYDNDILTIIRGNMEYEFPLSSHISLFEGAKSEGVEFQKIGYPEDTEDIMDEYEKEADKFNFLRKWDEYREW